MSSLVIREKTDEFLAQENALELICKHISCGGSIPDLCRTRNINYPDVAWWIKQSPSRQDMVNQARLDRQEWIVESICSKLADLADVEADDYLDDLGNVKPISEWTPRARYALSQFSITEGKESTRINVRMHDKMKPIELIGKYLGMFTDTLNVRAEEGAVDMIAGVARRVQERKAQAKLEQESSDEREDGPDSGTKHLSVVRTGA